MTRLQTMAKLAVLILTGVALAACSGSSNDADDDADSSASASKAQNGAMVLSFSDCANAQLKSFNLHADENSALSATAQSAQVAQGQSGDFSRAQASVLTSCH